MKGKMGPHAVHVVPPQDAIKFFSPSMSLQACIIHFLVTLGHIREQTGHVKALACAPI